MEVEMYTKIDFKSKKALKEAVKAYQEYAENPAAWTLKHCNPNTIGAVVRLQLNSPRPVTIYSPGPFPCPTDGRVALEGPHYPKPHSWYADCDVVDGVVVKVR